MPLLFRFYWAGCAYWIDVSVRPSTVSISDSLSPIKLKLNRVVGHHLRLVAFKIGATLKANMS